MPGLFQTTDPLETGENPIMEPIMDLFDDYRYAGSSAFAQLATDASLQALLAYQLPPASIGTHPGPGLRTEAEISSQLVAGLLAGSGYRPVEAISPDPRPLGDSALLQMQRICAANGETGDSHAKRSLRRQG